MVIFQFAMLTFTRGYPRSAICCAYFGGSILPARVSTAKRRCILKIFQSWENGGSCPLLVGQLLVLLRAGEFLGRSLLWQVYGDSLDLKFDPIFGGQIMHHPSRIGGLAILFVPFWYGHSKFASYSSGSSGALSAVQPWRRLFLQLSPLLLRVQPGQTLRGWMEVLRYFS